MKNKYYLLAVLLFAWCGVANAADWWIRSDGSNSTNCTGHSNAAYPGTGTAQACAFNNPSWVLGLGGSANNMSGGDAIYFGDASQYVVGMPDAPNGSACNSGWPYDCVLGYIPGGSDASHRTKVYGYGWDTGCTGVKTQIWGENRAWNILKLATGAGHFDIQCLDITDHSVCIENGPLDGNVDGQPVQCVRNTYPQGPWAGIGLYADTTHDVNLTNVDIHGMASKGIYALRNGDWTLTNTHVMGNGFVGWDSDVGGGGDSSYTGTTILQSGSKIDWNGCGERYPLQVADLDATANHHHCWEQSQGGYGDAIGLGNGDPGNWTVTDSSVSWNTSDGLDLVHSYAAGRSVKISRSRFEGNNGNQVKGFANHVNIENSLIIGNCGFFAGQSFTSTKDSSGNSVSMNFCRASGAAISVNMADGVDYNIYNNTIMSNGDTMIDVHGSSCSGAKLNIKNNILYGGSDFGGDSTNPYAGWPGQDDKADIFYNEGTGSCATLSSFLVEDYNICYLGKGGDDCVAVHDQNATNPLFTGTITMGPGTYYALADFYNQVHIPNSAPGVGAAVADETIYLVGTSNDASDTSRGAQWDVGAYEYGSASWGGSPPLPPPSTIRVARVGTWAIQAQTGYWYSPIIQVNAKSFSKLYWNTILGPTGSVSFAMRAGATSAACAAASWSSEFTNSAGADVSGVSGNVYVQLRATLTTADWVNSPVIELADNYNIKLIYSQNGTVGEAAYTTYWESGFYDFDNQHDGYSKRIRSLDLHYSGSSGTITVRLRNSEGSIDTSFDIDLSKVSSGEPKDPYQGDATYKIYHWEPPANSLTTPTPIGEYWRISLSETGTVAWNLQKIMYVFDAMPRRSP